MKKTVKAWAVVSERGRIEYTAPDHWSFHYGVFPRKSQALEEVRNGNESYTVVPCTITYTVPE